MRKQNETHYYDTVKSFTRQELGVKLFCHIKRGGYTEIQAGSPYSDAPSVFDNSAFEGKTLRSEFRNALRRHARKVKTTK